jgi:FkbM family methyltransferase
MIMCRWDDRGVANELLETSAHEQQEINTVLRILDQLKEKFRTFDVIDGGANVGTWTLQLAKSIRDRGMVYSFEPQKRLFYALAGNIALNNCLNVTARMEALSDKNGQIEVPQLPATRPAAMSTLSLDNPPGGSEPREYVPTTTIDSLGLHLKLLKLDIEGMEVKALQGARQTIERCRPVIFAEVWMQQKGDILRLLPDYVEHPLPEPRNSIFWPTEMNP